MLDNKGFDLWAEGYDKDVGVTDEDNAYPFAGYKRVLGFVYDRIMHRPGSSVLDIGFGTGTLASRLYQNGHTIFGQDFSERMIELAYEKMPDAKLYRGDFTEGLAEPLMGYFYDFIIATYSLHHLDDIQKASFIKDLLGRLNEGGALLIGDVAFGTRKELEKCRADAGDEWDSDEIYFVFNEFKKRFPNAEFVKASHCSGIIILAK